MLAVLGAAACNSDTAGVTNAGAGGTAGVLVVTEPGPISRDGQAVDSVELEGFDAAGNLVAGPITVPFSTTMTFDLGAAIAQVQNIELDYLRNGGLALFRVSVPRGPDGSFDLTDPAEQAVQLHDSGFAVVGNTVTVNFAGPEFGDTRRQQARVAEGIRFKGMCYSPAPINFRNIDGPAIGDLFWDRDDSKNRENWFALWGSGPLQMSDNKDRTARGDVNDMRSKGVNLIRTYCMISRQLFDIVNGNFISGAIPSPPDKWDHFTHQQFLDHCWNNGHDPIYVLIGIPLPSTVLYNYGGASAAERAYWDFVLRETVTDTHNHPAVLGYTLFNEIDENRSAWPGVNEIQLTGGVQNADSDYYYGKLIEYSRVIHDITGRDGDNRKLVGWAAHDNQPFVHYGSSVPAGNPYFSQLVDIDFYGVNTYQSQSLDSVLGNAEGRYGSLTGANKKPVILTEFGWPGVGQRSNDPSSIYEDAQTRANAAAVITRMIPQAYASPLVLGVCYFEYSDEWWKEPPNIASQWNGLSTPDGGMPNGYHDQEGFGLYSTARAGGRPTTDSPYDGARGRVVLPVDTYTPRTELIDALVKAYQAVQ
ncbi:MAG: hypothetical protein AB1758_15995 [Candidatus Eremiobacterota bacterium]